MNTEKNYEDLANAVVLQAVMDYRKALKAIAKHHNDRSARFKKMHILRFFRSDWFKVLTRINPEALISRLDKEAAIASEGE